MGCLYSWPQDRPARCRGHYAGFIMNRPTPVSLAKLFPEHVPSQKIVEPVYLGGPVDSQAIFALVERDDSPGGNSVELLPGLYLAFEGPIVDSIIESGADHARFFAGLVLWRPGEPADQGK